MEDKLSEHIVEAAIEVHCLLGGPGLLINFGKTQVNNAICHITND